MNPKEIKQIQNVCKVVSELKSQLIQELPHYGQSSSFLSKTMKLLLVSLTIKLR